MPEIKNVSPLGALDVPLLGVTVGAGETVTVTDEQAEALLAQPEVFQAVQTSSKGSK